MPISLTEVAFFAPFTMGVAVFSASTISSWVNSYTEQVVVLQKEARELDIEMQQVPDKLEKTLREISHDMQTGERYTTDVLDDLRTINIERDINDQTVPPAVFGETLKAHSVAAHRAKNINRTVWSCMFVLASIASELAVHLSPSTQTALDVLIGFNSLEALHTTTMLFLVYILCRTMLSLKSTTAYTSEKTRTLLWGQEALRKIRKQIDFSDAVGSTLDGHN